MRFIRALAQQRIPLLLGLLSWLLLGMSMPAEVTATQSSHARHSSAPVRLGHGKRAFSKFHPTRLDSASCQNQTGSLCYNPQDIQNAYNLTPILNAGYTGIGQTIVIIDSYGSPTITQDLKTFDAAYHLPDPPSFKVLSPIGTVPFDPNNSEQVGWAEETSLDVQWAHVMAPGANIVLLTSPVDETEGVQGLPEFLQLEQYALTHHLGKIVSQSWSATEETLFTPQGKALMDRYNAFYQQASKEHVTFFAASGDSGVLNPGLNGKDYLFPTVGFPASSPWVTGVGGTSLYLNAQNTYQSETVWNEGPGSASGGGFSRYFAEPSYQQTSFSPYLQTLAHGFRGVPDVAFNADPNTGIPVYLGFLSQPGYYVFGGTSAASPQWAGLIADANQLAGHPLGFLNEKLYQIGRNPALATTAYHDITVGNNSQPGTPGYNALPGWDAATGWGTPNANGLLPDLTH